MLNTSGFAYGYHNQETHLRRNWAYGLPVSQHDLKIHTLMAYAAYDQPNGVVTGCLDCTQLPVFSSPDIWWFFDPTDPQFGYCKVLNDQDTEAIELHCQNPTPWVLTATGFEPNTRRPSHPFGGGAVGLRSIPMGVTAPSYTDENGVTTNYAFSTDNASRIGDFRLPEPTTVQYWPPMEPAPTIAQIRGTCVAILRRSTNAWTPACLATRHLVKTACPALNPTTRTPCTMRFTSRLSPGLLPGDRGLHR